MNKFLDIKGDERGIFVEVFKIPGVGQASYSTTKRRGIVRGNHYHTHKIELFCVIEGEAKIRLRNRADNEIREYIVSGEKPELVEMIPNWTHNIENVGEGEMKLLIWANEVFDPQNPDTFAEVV
ncbi:MAG: WxcM-like domain-containing protein [Candidatus Jorgensenbacteria bacterium]|nr:WxcM-like domain-containing protein [Candidatus Jorgensenbacteria bacterium]